MGPNGVLFGKPRLSGQIFLRPLGVLSGFLESKGRGGRQHKYEYSPFSFISFLHVSGRILCWVCFRAMG